jgi:catalase
MPFPTDEKIMATAKDLVAQLQGIFGSHPGFRPGRLTSFQLKSSG